MILDPLSLKLFVSIVEEGSIAAAAEREHIAASAVSKRISELEDIFQTRLLRRTNRGVEATDAGITLLQLARGMLHDMNNIALQIREYASGVRGHVRLSANISSINQFLPREIRAFMNEHPQVHVHLEANISESIVNAVAENAADVGVVTMGSYRHDLEYLPYHTDQLVVITPKEHPLAARRSISYCDTLDYDFVGLPVGSALHNQLMRAALELDRTARLRIQVNSFDALCLMVEAGLGIGIVPKGAARPYLKGLRIRAITLDEPWALRDLKICIRSLPSLPTAARLLVEHLREK
ncbi:MAG: LysR family transcriptional regulator [Desulfuromonadaceae bacterium]